MQAEKSMKKLVSCMILLLALGRLHETHLPFQGQIAAMIPSVVVAVVVAFSNQKNVVIDSLHVSNDYLTTKRKFAEQYEIFLTC